MLCCSTEAAKSGEFVKKIMILENITDKGPHVLDDVSMLNLLKMSIRKSETDDSSGTETFLFFMRGRR